jgi:tetratricopeptide (TPR) repeat protein
VIDRALYLDDTNILVKAYLRRGCAYEKIEKFKLACNDLQTVKELQPYNQQAMNAMTRCLKLIKQDEGINYQPTTDDIELPKMEGIKTAEEQLRDEKVHMPKPSQPATPTPPAAARPEPEKVKVEEPKKDPKVEKMKDLEDKLITFKERGNTHFRKQAYKESIKHFSEAINLFEKEGSPLNDTIKLAVTQLLTNRSLAFHHLGQQNSALSDATYVIAKLDDKNAKALFRRAHAYKSINKWEEAARDL